MHAVPRRCPPASILSVASPLGRPLARPSPLAAIIAFVVVVAAACGSPTDRPSTAPSSAAARATPAGPPVLGVDWGTSANAVERPSEAFDQPTPDPSALAPLGPGRAGHPGHFPGQAIMADVAATASGYVSVGYVYPGWHPVAWTSPDGDTWSLHALGTTDFTFPVALAAGSDGTSVAVGRSGNAPVAWTSADGATWTEHAVPMLGTDGVAERMTTVAATPDGYLAGGSVGPEILDRHARFWRSPDARTWTPVPDEPAAFADAEVRSIVRFGAGYVAVGFLGTAEQPTGSVAWTSPDGEHWTRVDAPDLATGRAVALVVAPGGGLVAVGSDLNEHEAFAWTSPDGIAWTRVPGEPSRQYYGKIRMNDVTVAGGELVAVGDYNGMQFATMAAWYSTDGIRWTRAREVPAFGQGEPYAVVAASVPAVRRATTGGAAAGGAATGGAVVPGVIAVGSFGNPDNYIPTAWLSPAR